MNVPMVVEIGGKEIAIQEYSGEKIDELVDEVRQVVSQHVPDLTTHKGRAAIASLSRRVSSFKSRLDEMGKALVAEEKARISMIDAARKRARDQLDELRDHAREPLTKWEAAEKLRQEEEAAARALVEAAHAEAMELVRILDEACAEDILWERKRAADIREAELLAEQEAHAAKVAAYEKSVREAQEAREREEKEKAQREANELERRQRAEREAAEAISRKEREAAQLVLDAEKAERIRKEREERIRIEAEERARKQVIAEEAERKRLSDEAQRKAEKAAQRKANRKRIHDEAEAALARVLRTETTGGDLLSAAAVIVETIAAGQVPHITISYLAS